MIEHEVKFHIGQIIEHNKFGYRGVIYDVDAQFSGTNNWYETVAKSKPPKDAPWYHVLVDGSLDTTYVAERHIQATQNHSEVNHPLIEVYFSSFKQGRYILPSKQ